tara:strand:- start:329 stop:883 length:555 start_codon:yes stop_codon:yes gene_type:complete
MQEYYEDPDEEEVYRKAFIERINKMNKSLEDKYNLNLREKLVNVLLKCFDERFNEIKNYELMYCKVKKHKGMIWTFYQFSQNKYMIEVYIYSSQWNDKNYLLFGMYDGVIDTEIEKPEKIDFMKYDKKDYSNDKYQIIINEINKLSLKQLRDKCVELSLKKSGSKPFLIERILIHELNLNYLVS